LFAVDEVGTITYINERLAQMTGQSRSVMIGKPASALAADDESRASIARQLAQCQRGQHDTYEMELVRHDDATLEVSVNPFPLFDASGATAATLPSSSKRVRTRKRQRG
jgi:PAS domain S-box-containing protein